jgi:hypothetical protein
MPSLPIRAVRDGAILLAVALGSVVVSLAALPRVETAGDAPYVVVFAPWVSGRDALLRSVATGAGLVREGRSPFVIVLAGRPATRPAGALLMLRLDGLGCYFVPAATEAVSWS